MDQLFQPAFTDYIIPCSSNALQICHSSGSLINELNFLIWVHPIRNSYELHKSFYEDMDHNS